MVAAHILARVNIGLAIVQHRGPSKMASCLLFSMKRLGRCRTQLFGSIEGMRCAQLMHRLPSTVSLPVAGAAFVRDFRSMGGGEFTPQILRSAFVLDYIVIGCTGRVENPVCDCKI
jgi:hypothetical protein